MKTLLDPIKPTHITLLEKTGEYRKVPLGDFVSMLGANAWSEQLLIPRELSDAYDKASVESIVGARPMTPQLLHMLRENTLDCFEKLCAFVDRGSHGFGFDVVARTTIPAGQIICAYVGDVFLIETKPMAPYAVAINERVGIDAEKNRCLASMFSHLPSEGNCQFANPEDAKDIAFKNLAVNPYVYQDPVSKKPQIICLLKTLREILPGEIMGWDYGVDYWNDLQIEPHFFTRKGAIIKSTPPFKNVAIIVKIELSGTISLQQSRDIILDTHGKMRIRDPKGEIYAETSSDLIRAALEQNPGTNSITVVGQWVQSNHATNFLLSQIMGSLSIGDAQWKAENEGETACLSMPHDRMESLRKIESAFRAFDHGPDALEISTTTRGQTISIGLHHMTLAKLQQIQKCITTKSSPLPRAYFDAALLTPCYETAVVKKLNQSSGLTFRWGHVDYNVHAYVEVDSDAKLEQCQRIQQQLPSQFCRFFGTPRPTLFVLHNVNDPSNTRGIFNAFP